jgi:putative transposase
MAGLHLEKGTIVEIKGRRYTCGGRGPGGSYLLAPHQGRGNRYLKPEALFDQVQNGDLKMVEETEYYGEPLPDGHFDLTALADTERDQVLMRQFYMQHLNDYRSKDGKLSDAALNDFARRTHEAYVKQCRNKGQTPPPKPMSATAIRRWFRAWTKSGFQVISLVRDARGNSHSKLTPEQKGLLEAAINEDFLDTRRLTAKYVHKLMSAKINVENRARKVDGRAPIPTPHYNTLLAHINRINLFDKLKARFNAQYALKVTREYGMTPPVDRHLERTQVDHTQLDLYVDFGDESLARPWLTLLLDSYSKAILGYWLTPEPPSAESVMQALRIAVMPKDVAVLGGEPTWPWPMYGTPTELTLDNGKEFHGKDLEMAAAELGVILTFTPPRKPYYKAQIERKFGEINRSLLSQLTGQVFKYEPEKHGTDYPHLSFDDFKRIFLQWVCTVLHRTPNQDGNTPEELWYESVQKFGTPGAGLAPDYIEMCLSKSGPGRIIHPNGIHFNSLTFNNEWLSRLRNELAPKTGNGKPTAKFKWSASDVGIIWVLDPNTNGYFPVRSKEEYAHGRSLYNHRVVLREKRHRRKAKMSDDSYLDAVLAVDQAVKSIVDGKKMKKKRLGTKAVRYENGKPDPQQPVAPIQPAPLSPDETIQQLGDDQIDTFTGEILSTDSGITVVTNAVPEVHESDFEDFADDLEI